MINYYQQHIAGYISKLLRDHFGKGPESVTVAIGGQYIIVHLRSFLTSSERLLLAREYEMIIHQMRDKLMQICIEKEFIRLGHGELLKAVKRNLERNYLRHLHGLEEILNRKISDFFVDYHYESDQSVVVIMMQDK